MNTKMPFIHYSVTKSSRSSCLQKEKGNVQCRIRYYCPFTILQSRYSTALYFCFTGLVSVGFGNVAPTTDNEMIFSITLMLFGCKFTCTLIAISRDWNALFPFHFSLGTSLPFISRLQLWLRLDLAMLPPTLLMRKFMLSLLWW